LGFLDQAENFLDDDEEVSPDLLALALVLDHSVIVAVRALTALILVRLIEGL